MARGEFSRRQFPQRHLLMLVVMTWRYVLLVLCFGFSESSVLMRKEECFTNGTKSRNCVRAIIQDTLASVGSSHRQISVLGVDQSVPAVENSPYTPLPFAAFLQPRPVFQGAEERVFNVLDKERTVQRLSKGGKRLDEDEESETESLAESENSSRSHVSFRRRKGGRRSDRQRQLRKERIERKRARRKNRRKNKREKKRKMNKHPKHRRGRKRKKKKNKVKKNKLRSLNTPGQQSNHEEFVGQNPTIFIEDSPFAPAELKLPERGTEQEDSTLFDNSDILNNNDQNDDATAKETRVFSEGLDESSHPYIDVHNYHEAKLDFDLDYDSEEEDPFDMEYDIHQTDDYQIGPDYFNWKDNSSFDYFLEGEETTVSPDSRHRDRPPPSASQLDPSHILVRRHLVRLHNLLRSKVQPRAANMLAMSWHGAAASQARRWAGSCVTHRGRDDPNARWTPRYGACGQNVLVTRRKKRWGQVIRTWWGERRFFEYGAGNALNGTYKARSYTQLVWYSSHRVGCGYSECTTSGGVTYHRYVCNYCPAGNDPGKLSEPYTTGRPCEMCPRACRSVCPEGQCRLCTNRCPFSDLWANCGTLAARWREWLCNTKTAHGVERFKNCRATCQCALAGDKII